MRILLCSLVLSLALVALSCGGSSSQNTASAQIRIMQASSDLGNVDVQVNGNPIATNLGWRQLFPMPTNKYASVPAGTVQYQEFATGTTSPAVVNTQLAVSPNTYYTIVTAGLQSSGSLSTILLTDDHVAPSPGQLRLRFVNAASTVGAIDLYYASGPNAGLPLNPSVPALAYKSATGYVSFSGTSAQLCANPAGVAPSGPGGIGGIGGGGSYCLLSVTLQFQSPPQSSMTFLLLDPYLPANAPPGTFTTPVVLAGIPF